jgi:hypothetical protein
MIYGCGEHLDYAIYVARLGAGLTVDEVLGDGQPSSRIRFGAQSDIRGEIVGQVFSVGDLPHKFRQLRIEREIVSKQRELALEADEFCELRSSLCVVWIELSFCRAPFG